MTANRIIVSPDLTVSTTTFNTEAIPRVTNALAVPSDPMDLTTKSYVDFAGDLYLVPSIPTTQNSVEYTPRPSLAFIKRGNEVTIRPYDVGLGIQGCFLVGPAIAPGAAGPLVMPAGTIPVGCRPLHDCFAEGGGSMADNTGLDRQLRWQFLPDGTIQFRPINQAIGVDFQDAADTPVMITNTSYSIDPLII